MPNFQDIIAYNGNGEYIFISYSHKDKAIVLPFIAALQKEFNVWFDEGIHYGSEWEEEIVKKLHDCTVFIFMISNNSIESENCKDELYLARELKKNFINILLDENVELPSWFTLRYKRFQMCNYYSFSSASLAIEDLKRKCTWFDSLYKETHEAQKKDTLFITDVNDEDECLEDELSFETYLQAAEQGDATAQYKLGFCYAEGISVNQDYTEAVKWYRKAAEQGLAVAQYNLGYCFYRGFGVTQDYKKAVKWYRKAAEQGDANYQYILGLCFENGIGVSQYYKEAVKWYRKAAEQGNDFAQCSLGYCYEKGHGVPKDFAEAAKWYRKAAEQGYATAQYNLGCIYYNGYGVTQDYKEAVDWYRKAAEQGDSSALRALEAISSDE